MSITVLGKTFDTEKERREYFRNELRKHLPELKKMEGFPIGEDEDIINLSDPPYYTACPNPWLNEFIEEWEEEKKELEKERVRDTTFEVSEPYATDVSVGKKNPIYTAHTYPTKVPHPAIVRYLLHYTQPGDIVFDGFAGTGMTGVAAQMCGNPDPKSKFEIEHEFKHNFNFKPKWGVRKSILSDLSPIANFISYNFNKSIDVQEFSSELDSIFKKMKEECGWIYETIHVDGVTKGLINYTVWSDVFSCSNCESEMVFWNLLIDEKNKKANEDLICPNCGVMHTKRNLTRVWANKYDEKLKDVTRSVKKVPVLIKYSIGKKGYLKKPDQFDFELLNKIREIEKKYWYPINKLHKGDKTGEPERLGILHAHQFFTDRTLFCLSSLADKVSDKELILLTSMLNRSSFLVKTLLSNYLSQLNGKTVGGWAGTPLDGTLYIPSINSEVSVLASMKSRISSLRKMVTYKSSFVYNSNIGIQTGSSTILSLKDNSVDYIFTDPPFGSNRMYSDLNFINESWIKVFTNSKEEAIESKTQRKKLYDYQILMHKIFNEYFRVLKPGKWMTVEFSNTSAAVWNSIQTALQNSGFIVSNVSGLDKKQGSFNSVNNVKSVKQDLVISCYKPSSTFDQKFQQHQYTELGIWDFIEEHLHHLPIHLVKENSTTAIIERSPKILFDRLIAFYVQRGLPVPIDAGKFQIGLRERFIERDGMFFTNEQVQVYDRKKKEVPNFIQLSILVSSEQDGVLWLKNLLEKNRLTYQDIQPSWMQALAGVRKGDIIPELAHILEENFLKDREGKWYVPDPENEADLEKLRTKRLLKQFDTYKEIAFTPKGKIKECRVDALRAGFKQCYQEKDFQTIVKIGDRIPNNLLMEDEVLLQFYDIASTRV